MPLTDSFAAWYREHREHLRAFAFQKDGIAGSDLVASAIATFANLLSRNAPLPDRGNWFRYVCGIIRNKWRRLLRMTYREKETLSIYLPPPNDPSPADDPENRELLQLAYESLHPRAARAWQLEVEGLSKEAIAEELGLSVAGTYVLLCRTRVQIRQKMLKALNGKD